MSQTPHKDSKSHAKAAAAKAPRKLSWKKVAGLLAGAVQVRKFAAGDERVRGLILDVADMQPEFDEACRLLQCQPVKGRLALCKVMQQGAGRPTSPRCMVCGVEKESKCQLLREAEEELKSATDEQQRHTP